MKLTLAIVALLAFTITAYAADVWVDGPAHIVTLKPPAEYLRQPTEPIVELDVDLAGVNRLCATATLNVDPETGCAVDTHNPKQIANFFLMYSAGTTAQRKLMDQVLIKPAYRWIIVVIAANGFNYTDALHDHVRIHEIGHVNGWVHK